MSQQQTTDTANAVVKVKAKEVVDLVGIRLKMLMESGGLQIPGNYNAQNALQLAALKLMETEDRDKRLALEVTTRESQMSALLKMVIMGLNPAKNQCYFIVYGNKLELSVSYLGRRAMVKRVIDVVSESTGVIYEGDDFQYGVTPENGRVHLLKHEQKFENIDPTKMKGAYAVIVEKRKDGSLVQHFEVMNIGQIKKAWAQRKGEPESKAHQNFGDMMAMKTVMSRLCNRIWNASDDAYLDTDDDEPTKLDFAAADVVDEIDATQTAPTKITAPVPESVTAPVSSQLFADAPPAIKPRKSEAGF